jgi:hypothetical protein
MTRLLFLLLVLLSSRTIPATEALQLRMTLDPADGILVGQQIRLNLDLLARDGWANLDRLPQLELPGAWLMRVETQGTRLSETIDGDSYSGQRYQWLLFPQRSGDFTLAPVALQVSIKTFGSGGGEQSLQRSTPALAFSVIAPPGTAQLPGLITSDHFSISQQWQPGRSAIRLGDGIRRTITRQAKGIAGMAFRPLGHADIADVAIYPGEPEVRDQVNRGTLESGQRSESLSYVPQRPGRYHLPDITVHWWDPAAGRLREQTLSGLTLSVSAAKPTAGDGAVQSPTPSLRTILQWIALIGVSVFLLFGLWQRYGRPCRQGWRQRRRDSEAAYFARFTAAARAGDTAATINALMAWLDRLALPQRPARLEPFLARYGDPAADNEVDKLFRTLDDGRPWQAESLIAAIGDARRRWLASTQVKASAKSALPPLNPVRSGCMTGHS